MNTSNLSVSPGGSERPTLLIAILAAAALALALSSCGPRYVTTAPAAAVVVRPVAPYPNAVWIDGGYRWRRGVAVPVNGYWARPRPGRVYAPGVWVSESRGYRYRRGGWR